MTDAERKAELERLNRMLVSSTGRDGYKDRIEAIKKRIAELERDD